MKIPFWKMHGAGNDFVLIDDRKLTAPVADRFWLSSIGQRRTGVGCEGVILIQPSTKADFTMRFFNPDGSEVDMCGNGARCVARLAYDLKVAPATMRFETGAGIIAAEMVGDQVRLGMTTPKEWRLNQMLELDGVKRPYGFVNSGVPHVVMPLEDLDREDVAKTGASVRYHKDFAPKGTNANFIHVTGPSSLRVRTYERGVEAETLACGTGMVASGLIAGRMGWVKPPVKITCAGGDVLEVNFVLTGDGAQGVTLLGPAVYVFTGELDAP
ncbi:MAG: diaminopimelate epimerase [bacterium]|jgi:diaminopimelate epimerase